MIKIKRIYERPKKEDGFRIFIDGLWAQGISKEEAPVQLWLRQIAPSPALKKWFGHTPKKFDEFSKRYKKELSEKKVFLRRILDIEKQHDTVTLLYAAKDTTHNNALVVQEYLSTLRNP
jgi:uncharacterized protein YeaO (DUF488 family)